MGNNIPRRSAGDIRVPGDIRKQLGFNEKDILAVREACQQITHCTENQGSLKLRYEHRLTNAIFRTLEDNGIFPYPPCAVCDGQNLSFGRDVIRTGIDEDGWDVSEGGPMSTFSISHCNDISL